MAVYFIRYTPMYLMFSGAIANNIKKIHSAMFIAGIWKYSCFLNIDLASRSLDELTIILTICRHV